MMSIVKLPDGPVSVVCEFLRVESSSERNQHNIQTNIRAVLDTCKRLRELKLSEVGMWHFKRECAEQYHTDDAFRARVYEALAMPDRDGNPQQQQLPIGMDLSKSSMTDVSALGNVHTLNLYGCAGITDVSALGSVHTLDLRECTGIVDVSALGSVHTLDLYGCAGITDVSALGSVHTLNLSECTGITDVSALGSVHTLDLCGCTGITDVSALGSVHTLIRIEDEDDEHDDGDY
jgi:hypothetical protein